ncbi:MAG: phosphoglucosamine mutase, partial [Alphaproteobacteria bacterium]|nr:phosphoglucosamine mutase [Alphaproteobacteria bacterium]
IVLGGEQAGHLILGDYATTGDGLLAALHVIRFWRESGKKASAFLNVFQPFPQVLKNVRFSGESPLQKDVVKEAIKNGETKLKTTGRLLVRASGTEPLIRVMAEGRDLQFITNVVDEICGEIEKYGKAS